MLVGLDLLLADWRMGAGVRSTHRSIGVRGETVKAVRETADLWQSKWNENQTVLATAIHILDGAVAGSWSLGIVEQSQGERCC